MWQLPTAWPPWGASCSQRGGGSYGVPLVPLPDFLVRFAWKPRRFQADFGGFREDRCPIVGVIRVRNVAPKIGHF